MFNRLSLGALLSQLIEPIYYTSIIIGSLYHSEHIRRALFARIEHVRIRSIEMDNDKNQNRIMFRL